MLKQGLRTLLIPLVLLVTWIILGGRLPPVILPTIGATFRAFRELIAIGELGPAWLWSMYRIGYATLLSVVICVPLGLLSKSFRGVKEIVTPFTNFIRYIPVTVFYPLLIVWLGIDESMRVAFLFIATFFVFFPAVMLTLESIDEKIIERALTCGANKWQMIWHVYIPATLPALCRSFLTMFSVGFTYMIIAETINVRHGLGYLMTIGSARGRTDMVFAAILVTIITGVVIDITGKLIIKAVFRWERRS